MLRLSILALCCAALVAACNSSGKSGALAPQTSNAAHIVAPAPDPTRYRIETVIYELPLPVAEDLYAGAQASSTTIGIPIDEAKCREALDLLAAANASIVRIPRPDLTLAAGALGRIPARIPTQVPGSVQPASPQASDFLELDVRATPLHDWIPVELDVHIRWSDAHGRVLGRLPAGAGPLPEGYWMQIVCLPSKDEWRVSRTPALFGFMRVIPL